jgi:solute:Na+ symporter, SSS family
MQSFDWFILIGTLLIVFVYGWYQMRNTPAAADTESYLVGTKNLKWWTIGLSIMATQASAVTFLSTPGQAYSDGIEFGQFYFGMPLAMILIALFVAPRYYKMQVTTAYSFLEERFGVGMRTFTAVIFLLLRSVSSAITLLAPSIVLSVALGWDLQMTTLLMSGFVIAYTALGGNEAVSRTQELQMAIMLAGLIAAFVCIVYWLPDTNLTQAWSIATASGRTKLIDWSFSWGDRYNIWSGMLATVFLFLSYFGTDQSQVGRYLSGKSLKEIQIGLVLNGLLKVPMQLLVLSVGVMVFVFYQLHTPPLHFNPQNQTAVLQSAYAPEYALLQARHDSLNTAKSTWLHQQVSTGATIDTATTATYDRSIKQIRKQATALIQKVNPAANVKDSDYVFIHFVLSRFPSGLIGFIIAMIFCAAWSTTASELSALTAASITDIYRRSLRPNQTDAHYLRASKWTTIIWGCILALIALKAGFFENLIQAVNMAGSVFYGTILGIFATAFYLHRVQGIAVMIGALVAQSVVLFLFLLVSKDAFLWYIPLGAGLVMGVGYVVQLVLDWLDAYQNKSRA